MKIIAYTYEADVHCPACVRRRFGEFPGKHSAPGFGIWNHPIDEHEVRVGAVDREGNPVRPVFSTDEHDFTHCSDCGAEL